MTTNMKFLGLLLAVGALTACATVTDETRATITVDGQEYTTVTRQFDQNGRTLMTGSVIYAGRSFGCDTTQPGSCEAMVRRLRDGDVIRTVEGANASSFVIPGMN